MRLALVLARGGDRDGGARRCSSPPGAETKIEGRTRHAARPRRGATSTSISRIRPAAYLLSATLAVEPDASAGRAAGRDAGGAGPRGRVVVVEHAGLRRRRRGARRLPAPAAGRGGARSPRHARASRELLLEPARRRRARLEREPARTGRATQGRRRRPAPARRGRGRPPAARRSSTTSPSPPCRARRRCGPTSAASRSSAGTSATTTASRSPRSPKASWCGCGSA